MKKTDHQKKDEVPVQPSAATGESEDWKAKYIRALADYQNLEKRSQARIDEVRQFAAEMILQRLLPVVDTCEKVKEHLKDPGLDIAYKELVSVLTEQGVTRMAVVGKPFNPAEMDCVEVVPGSDNAVVEEVMPGYVFRGKILRVARVKVGASEPKT